MVRLHVTGPSGVTRELDLPPSAPVSELKPLLEEAEGIPPAEQALSFCGAPLDDARSLADSGLGEDASLALARLEERFEMPRNRHGDPDFGRAIEDDLAAWRAAHPGARVANLLDRELSAADLGALRGVRGLRLIGCTLAPPTATFAPLAGLQALEIRHRHGDDPGLGAALAPLAGSLRSLTVRFAANLSDGDLAPLAGLEELELVSCSRMTGECLGALGGRLRALRVHDCRAFDGAHLARHPLPALEELGVIGHRGITDAHLAPLTGLRKLAARTCPRLTHAAWSPMRALEDLDVSYNEQLTDAGLDRATLPALRVLRAERCPVISAACCDALRAAGVEVRDGR